MARRKKNPHMGSTLDSFLKEEGIYESPSSRLSST